MDKSIIKSIILEKHQEIRQLPVMDRGMEFDPALNYVLVGIRRSGKSYTMFNYIKKLLERGDLTEHGYVYINFEDERISNIKAEDLGLIIDCHKELFGEGKPLIFLDEIQNIDGWEKFARRIADSKYRVMITGSNAKMLSGEILTTIGGRYIAKNVYPFTFAEYLSWNGLTRKQNWEFDKAFLNKSAAMFNKYFHFGGFAEIFNINDKREWINSLLVKILLGDIIDRNNIRNTRSIRFLTKKLAESVMQPISISRLTNILGAAGEKVSRNTVSDYLDFIQDACLIFKVNNICSVFAERETNCKRYFIDNALLSNYLFDADSKLLENMIAIDMLQRYRRADDDGFYYYNKDIEVDFYVPKENLAVQVARSISDSQTMERETNALKRFSKFQKIKRAVIVTLEQEERFTDDDIEIEIIPAAKWLLRN